MVALHGKLPKKKVHHGTKTGKWGAEKRAISPGTAKRICPAAKLENSDVVLLILVFITREVFKKRIAVDEESLSKSVLIQILLFKDDAKKYIYFIMAANKVDESISVQG